MTDRPKNTLKARVEIEIWADAVEATVFLNDKVVCGGTFISPDVEWDNSVEAVVIGLERIGAGLRRQGREVGLVIRTMEPVPLPTSES